MTSAIRTLLVCVTVAFLGYLGFTLAAGRIRGSTQDGAAQVDLRAALDSVRSDLSRIEKRVSAADATSNDLEQLASEFSALRGRVDYLVEKQSQLASAPSSQDAMRKGAGHSDVSASRGPEGLFFGLSPQTRMEYGTASINIVQHDRASKWFSFRTPFKEPPVVVVSHSGKGGAYTTVLAEQIAKDKFAISMRILPDEGMKHGELGLAWIAIGEVPDSDAP